MRPHVIQEEIYSFLTVIYLTLVLPKRTASIIIIPLAIVSGFVRVKVVYRLFEHFLSSGASIHHDLCM